MRDDTRRAGRRARAGLVLAAAAMAAGGTLAIAGCGGASGGAAYDGSGSAAGAGAARGGGTTIAMHDDYFSPSVVSGPPGGRVTLTLRNEGRAEHNFTIASQGVDTDVAPGATARVTVTFPRSGILAFDCEYHAARGMTGRLRAT